MLPENSSRSGASGAGAAKHGAALLAGLLCCRRCGRKLRVAYSGPQGNIPRYQCDRGLARVRAVEQRVEIEVQQAPPRSEADREGLRRLAEDLPRVGHDPGVDARTKKRVLRCVIHEIVVDLEEPRKELLLIVHWVGGIHTELRVGRRRGQNGSQTAQDLVDAVRLLALICDDDMIAGSSTRTASRRAAEIGGIKSR